MALIYNSLIRNHVEYFSLAYLPSCIPSSVKCLWVFCLFSQRYFLKATEFWVWVLFHNFDVRPLLEMWFVRVFSPSVACLFIFFLQSFYLITLNLKFLLIHLKGRETERGRQRDIPPAGPISKCPQWPGLGQAKTKVRNFMKVSSWVAETWVSGAILPVAIEGSRVVSRGGMRAFQAVV